MYVGEIRLNWQPLLSATLRIALRSSLNHRMMSLSGITGTASARSRKRWQDEDEPVVDRAILGEIG